MALSLIILIVGILGVALGGIIIKYKMGCLVSWVNLKKYDNDKVANIMGSHLMVLGICLIAISGVNYVLKDTYQNIIAIVLILSCFAAELGAYYRIYKYAKLEN